MRFEDGDLLASLDRLAPPELDGLPFGVVKMSGTGEVAAYNTFESRLSGLSAPRVVGKQFFVDVAPCTNNFIVAQRLLDAASLDETIDYVFTYKMKPTPVRLRMLRGLGASHMYLVIELRG